MARNFQAKEAHDILNNKKDTETFCEFVRRFPSLSAVVLTGDIATLVKGIPFGSARQFDKAIFDIMNGNTTDSSDVSEVDNDEAEAEAENVEEKEEAPAEKPTKRGRKKSEPQPEAEEEAEEAEEAEEEDEKPASKYAGKSSKELYMLCQKAGLKVKEKQPAEYYLEKLEYADKKAAEAAAKAKPASKAEAESDDWDDEEPAEEKPTKKAKGKAKEESDDDDWDF